MDNMNFQQDPNVVPVQPINPMEQSMDQNMNQPLPQQSMEPQIPVQPMEPNMGPQMGQPVNPSMDPQMPQQPMEAQMPVQPMEPNMGPQMGQPVDPNMVQQPVNPMGPQGEVPVINVDQTPTEVFGQPVNGPQPNDPTRMNQMIDSINAQQQPVEPKYGYNTNEQKPNLNADSNINLKIVIFIAILIFAFIMALPYLSAMLDK